MEPKDLRKGDYVYEKFEDWNYHYIIKIGSGKSLEFKDDGRILFNNSRRGDLGNRNSFIKKATQKEKAHLDACIKANKYVEPLKIDNYQMY